MNKALVVILLITSFGFACGKSETPGPTPQPTAVVPGPTSGPCDEITEYAAPGSFQCVKRHSTGADRVEVPCSANPCPAGS